MTSRHGCAWLLGARLDPPFHPMLRLRAALLRHTPLLPRKIYFTCKKNRNYNMSSRVTCLFLFILYFFILLVCLFSAVVLLSLIFSSIFTSAFSSSFIFGEPYDPLSMVARPFSPSSPFLRLFPVCDEFFIFTTCYVSVHIQTLACLALVLPFHLCSV